MKREKTVDKCVDNSVNNLFVYPQNPLNGVDRGISTRLFTGIFEDFHTFLLKKDINLLNLHRKRELWIK